jgi:hypothetical protein
MGMLGVLLLVIGVDGSDGRDQLWNGFDGRSIR